VLTEEPGAGPDALPCDGCPQLALQQFLASPAGALIRVLLDLDFAIQLGVQVSLREIPYTMFLLLRQLAEERDKYQAEEIRKNQRNR